jgi:hypothetical protein
MDKFLYSRRKDYERGVNSKLYARALDQREFPFITSRGKDLNFVNTLTKEGNFSQESNSLLQIWRVQK